MYASTEVHEWHNSTKSGRMNMYSGAQQSVNTFFAQLERKTGLCEPYALAKAMGVELTDPDHERVPTFTLGIADVSPLEMAGAYATVAARGKFCENRPVTQILNSDNKVFKNYPKQCHQVLQESTADSINDILRGVMTGSGFGAPLALDKPSAGKTGTINNNMTVWFDGYTPALATAAMVSGADSNGNWVTLNGQSLNGHYIDVAHGSTVAGPMWALAMRAVQDKIPYENFTPPSRSSSADQVQVQIPDVKGMSTRRAAERLASAGFYVSIGNRQPSSERDGTVASTSPAAGQSAPRGSTVYVYPSSG
jgi:membrane peptidoglycan carboxypeptidase